MSWDDATDKRLRSALTATTGVTGMGLLAHLRAVLKERADGIARQELEGVQVGFDTVQRIALEATRRAYIEILDDPITLEAIKKELTA